MDIKDRNRTYPIGELLGMAAPRAVAVVRGIADERLASPTPCSEYDVRALLDHLTLVVVNFQELAAKRSPDFSVTPAYVREGADWRAFFAAEVRTLVEAWSVPGAEEGTSGAMGLPARTVGVMVLGDLTVHAWDLARATGQGFDPDPRVVAGLSDEIEQMAPLARKMGVFGEQVALPEGASAFERVLATTGRDPGWRLA